MNDAQSASLRRIYAHLPDLLPAPEAAYEDVHAHPELSMQETRTEALAAKHLADCGYAVTTGIGKTCVVGVLHIGAGPTTSAADSLQTVASHEVAATERIVNVEALMAAAMAWNAT